MVCHHNTHQSSTLLFSKALKIRQKAASSRDYHINHHHTGAQGLDFPSIQFIIIKNEVVTVKRVKVLSFSVQ